MGLNIFIDAPSPPPSPLSLSLLPSLLPLSVSAHVGTGTIGSDTLIRTRSFAPTNPAFTVTQTRCLFAGQVRVLFLFLPGCLFCFHERFFRLCRLIFALFLLLEDEAMSSEETRFKLKARQTRKGRTKQSADYI